MRHVPAPDESRRVGEPVRVRRTRRPQQQRRRVHRAARDDDERRLDAHRLAIPFHLDGLDLGAARVGDQPAGARVGPERDVGPQAGRPDAQDVGLALGVLLARERVARVAEDATVHLARLDEAQRQRRGMQPLARQVVDDLRHQRRVRDGAVRVGPARRLGRVDAVRAVDVVEPFGPVVEGLERVVVDGPGGRHAVHVLDGLEVLAPQPVEHAAPELGVAAYAVVGVGPELVAACVEPPLGRPVAKVLPDGCGLGVLRFSRHEIAAFHHQDARRGRRQGVGHRPAARPGADDDDVVSLIPHRIGRSAAGPVTLRMGAGAPPRHLQDGPSEPARRA